MPAMRLALLAPILLGLAGPAAGAGPASHGTTKSVLPFHEDDYPGALAEARAKKLPIFIEAWAPW